MKMNKKMRALLVLVLSLKLMGLAYGGPSRGPITHERTDTPLKQNAHVGRFLYVGAAPNFTAEEMDLTVSKMGLTLRATGWMTGDKIDCFAGQLHQRWERIHRSMGNPKFFLHPMIDLKNIPRENGTHAWAKVASQYSQHVLENRDIEVYKESRNASSLVDARKVQEYHSNLSTAILRYFFADNSLTPEALSKNSFLLSSLTSKTYSRKLFKKHFQEIYTETDVKNGFVGNLTFIYPIAATVDGPFGQPSEQTRTLLDYGSMNARWWSDKYSDDYGGFPFLMINSVGVAFHGPISNYAPMDVWYLKRGYVSHGCHRMDSSDIIELRSILPKNLKELGKVRLTILNNFDVVDWNNDGSPEVMDVKYYDIPSTIGLTKGKSVDSMVKPYLIENQMKSFFQQNAYAQQLYNQETDTISGAQKYKISQGQLIKDGLYGVLPIARFNYHPNRILQYREEGVLLEPYEDDNGHLPPSYFLNN